VAEVCALQSRHLQVLLPILSRMMRVAVAAAANGAPAPLADPDAALAPALHPVTLVQAAIPAPAVILSVAPSVHCTSQHPSCRAAVCPLQPAPPAVATCLAQVLVRSSGSGRSISDTSCRSSGAVHEGSGVYAPRMTLMASCSATQMASNCNERQHRYHHHISSSSSSSTTTTTTTTTNNNNNTAAAASTCS
jgi:hypothetical protein